MDGMEFSRPLTNTTSRFCEFSNGKYLFNQKRRTRFFMTVTFPAPLFALFYTGTNRVKPETPGYYYPGSYETLQASYS
jgi:hypothetical protein